MNFKNFKRRLRATRYDESGFGFLTLVVVSIIVVITAGIVTTSATFSMKFVSNQLSTMKANDLSQAALAEAVSEISKNNCQLLGSNDDLGYSFDVYHSNADSAPTSLDAPSLQQGCPTVTDKWVMIVAEGSGPNDKNSTTVATYKWQDTDVAVIPQVASGKNVNLNEANLTKDQSVVGKATIYVSGGKLTCSSSSQIDANLKIISDTTASNFGDCVISGNVAGTPDLYMGSSTVEGNACSEKVVSASENVLGEIASNSLDCNTKGSLYGYKPNLSQAIEVSGNQCTDLTVFKDLVEGLTEPSFVDVTGCTESNSFILLNGSAVKELNIKTDITIIADAFDVRRLTVNPVGDNSRVLNFVVSSDEEDSSKSTCASPYNSTLREVTYTPGASGMIYSACDVSVYDSEINGQIYGGNAASIFRSEVLYTPIGLPGISEIVSSNSEIKPLIRVF